MTSGEISRDQPIENFENLDGLKCLYSLTNIPDKKKIPDQAFKTLKSWINKISKISRDDMEWVKDEVISSDLPSDTERNLSFRF